MSRFVTLADYKRKKAVLYCTCRQCKRVATLGVDEVPRPLDTPIADIIEKLRCSHCGARGADCVPFVNAHGVPPGPNANAKRSLPQRHPTANRKPPI